MKAAVVSAFGTPPRYADFPDPDPAGGVIVDVLASGLHPRVRSQADGSHYTSTGELPLVPGIDGVGRGADGQLRYFVLPNTVIPAAPHPDRLAALPALGAPATVLLDGAADDTANRLGPAAAEVDVVL